MIHAEREEIQHFIASKIYHILENLPIEEKIDVVAIFYPELRI